MNSESKTADPKEIIQDLLSVLEDAHSGYIPGCGSDTAWDGRKEQAVKEALDYVNSN